MEHVDPGSFRLTGVAGMGFGCRLPLEEHRSCKAAAAVVVASLAAVEVDSVSGHTRRRG